MPWAYLRIAEQNLTLTSKPRQNVPLIGAPVLGPVVQDQSSRYRNRQKAKRPDISDAQALDLIFRSSDLPIL
jgi:hypothetical protein